MYSELPVVPATSELVGTAMQIAIQHQLSIFDAMQVAAAVAADCDRLITEDMSDGQVLRGVRIVNPFGAS